LSSIFTPVGKQSDQITSLNNLSARVSAIEHILRLGGVVWPDAVPKDCIPSDKLSKPFQDLEDAEPALIRRSQLEVPPCPDDPDAIDPLCLEKERKGVLTDLWCVVAQWATHYRVPADLLEHFVADAFIFKLTGVTPLSATDFLRLNGHEEDRCSRMELRK